MMHILITMFIGLVVGAIAKLLMPGKDPGGFIVTMLIGIAGSFIAGFFGKLVGLYQSPTAAPGIIASILGAMALLAVYRVITGRSLRHA
jgi:uncharacterized membrane protein YeaQ/YmgE (transglycosylase-associated protein family)